MPFAPAEVGGLPATWDALYWDGRDDPPDAAALRAVEFFVFPYGFHAAALPMLSRLPRLRVVQSLSAGVDDLLAELPEGVTLCNARGVHDASTAELAVALVLAALRGIPGFVRDQRARLWCEGFRPALAGRTVLLVGYGSIGAAVDERLAPFECRVLRVARSARDTARGPVHALERLPALLPEADVVVLTLPLTADSRGMVDAAFLARMRDAALLVNVARGPIVDTRALLTELHSGRLCAALDVTDPEPLPPDHALWSAPNTLISPHAGGSSSAFLPRARALVQQQLAAFVAGMPLANIVAGPDRTGNPGGRKQR
ncbi:2-hydroxyacid dehydrogenase [Streptacidiphilus anmyonensis]|uniref:2-hydroxyacid dehydrogenase n=1 Tax=Streptacidiphilus anmyonensis TaxID=405782 RepID=UPI000A03F62B|nr:2-hydroxyacid dehydrogenase [Streptacidiphilus anmyonensis]